jgi:hypothetical protein
MLFHGQKKKITLKNNIVQNKITIKHNFFFDVFLELISININKNTEFDICICFSIRFVLLSSLTMCFSMKLLYF